MKLFGENTIKAIIIGIVGLIAIFAVQRIAVGFIAQKIPAKSGGTAIYLIYGQGNDTYYAVNVNGQIVALFHNRQSAEKFAKASGGKVEVFPGGSR